MQFSTAVLNNEELSVADKFNCLSTLVTEPAAAAIYRLQVSGECYEDAVDILKRHFEDEKNNVQQHLQTLFGLQPASSSSSTTKLRDLYDKVDGHLRSLKALEQALLYVLFNATGDFLDCHAFRLGTQVKRTSEADDNGRCSIPDASTNRQTTETDKELQRLLEYLEHQLHCQETMKAYACPKTPEVGQEAAGKPRQARHRNFSSTAAI